MRSFKAFLLAPLPAIILFMLVNYVPAVIAGDYSWRPETLRIQLIVFGIGAVVIAYGLTAVFGFPLFAALKAAKVESIVVTVLAAAAIGSLLAIGPEILRVLTIQGTYSSQIGQCHDIVDNVRTLCGYRLLLKEAAVDAGLGGVAGLTFWHVYRHPNWYKLRAIGFMFAILAASALAAVFATEDRSCHNFMRGRDLISTAASLTLNVPIGQWNALVGELQKFAQRERLSFRYSISPPRYGNVLYASLCNDRRLNVEVNEVYFPLPPESAQQVGVNLYLAQRTIDWKPVWDRLTRQLKSRWKENERVNPYKKEAIKK